MVNELPPSNSELPGAGLGASKSAFSGGADTGIDTATERRFERVVSGAHDAVDTAAESVAQAAERLRTQAQRFTEIEREYAEAARNRVREHPLSAIAAALLLGVLLGRLSSR
jgi:ElaB/YqjD/DUF883 family membrane-anchored ribosome-binding protein